MKYLKSFFVFCLTFIILFSMCHNVFATNGNEINISSKEGIGNTIEIVSGNSNNIKSESVADVVSYLLGQGIIVNSITNHKGASVELTSIALIGTGYVLDTNNGTYSVIVYGDANGDGEADAGDMKVIIDNFLGIHQASPIAKVAVDLYQDGDLDAADLKQVLDSFLGNLTGSILKTTNASNPTPTPEQNTTEDGQQILVDGKSVILTKDNAGLYYGKKVTNYSVDDTTIWRLFYVDFDGKYGDAGKIYLKADPDSVVITDLNITKSVNSTSALNVMKTINKDWAENDGIVDADNEKAVLYLCDETNWSMYKDSEKADSVIGAASMEMFIDSYNEYHKTNKTSGYQLVKCKWFDKTSENKSKGYMYAVGETSEDYKYDQTTVHYYGPKTYFEIDPYNLYTPRNGAVWIASPSVCKSENIYVSYSNVFNSLSYSYNTKVCICPIVSLKSDFQLEIDSRIPAPQIVVGGQTVTLTKENAAEYYGKTVTNYNSNEDVTWRLFYVDFDGKYGETGKIYLKAEPIYNLSLEMDIESSLNSTSALYLMKKMNKMWAHQDGVINADNEKAILWLCDERNWENYKDSEKVDYIMGVPSVEMFLDSYDEFHRKRETSDYKSIMYYFGDSKNISNDANFSTSKSIGYYFYYSSVTSPITAQNSLVWDGSDFYRRITNLASPSIMSADSVCKVGSRQITCRTNKFTIRSNYASSFFKIWCYSCNFKLIYNI